MRAVILSAPGGPDLLSIGSYPTPEPAPGELLIRVAATALNRADTLQRRGSYPPPPGVSPILGLETAGVVAAVGAGCEGWAVGERVCGLLPGGGYAEFVVLPQQMAMRIPENLSFEEAAAIPEVFLTAYQALYWLGGLEAGQDVLVHAGASGVGTAAIQIIRAEAARAHITASAGKHETCKRLGATTTIDYRSEDVLARIREATENRGVDIILDFVGAPNFESNLKALAVDGRLVLLAMMGGAILEGFDLRLIFRKRAKVIGTTLRNRSDAYKADLTRDFSRYLLPLFEGGRLRPVIDTVYPWQDVAEAHRRMDANLNTGKIVLRVE